MLERERAIAWVVEEVAEEELGPVATGLFLLFIEPWLPDEEWAWTPPIPDRPVGLAAAVALGRQRASRVVVRIAGSGDQSAGEIPVEGAPLPDDLTLVRRRHPDWEFLDRPENAPVIEWDVVIKATRGETHNVWDTSDEAQRRRWWKALGTSPACERIELSDQDAHDRRFGACTGRFATWYASSSYPLAVVRVPARTARGACAQAARLAANAAAEVDWKHAAFAVTDAYPTGSTAARRNAHLTSH
jgi:hypothetical protein